MCKSAVIQNNLSELNLEEKIMRYNRGNNERNG